VTRLPPHEAGGVARRDRPPRADRVRAGPCHRELGGLYLIGQNGARITRFPAGLVDNGWRWRHAGVYWLPGPAGWPGRALQAPGPGCGPACGPPEAISRPQTAQFAGVRAWCAALFLVPRGGIPEPIRAADGAIIP
jgi:hypothetical protein